MAKNTKGKNPEAEKFRLKSRTNSIQYFSTEQAIQTMLQTGMDKQIMANNMRASHEIDRAEISNIGVEINDYRAEKIDIVETGRRADTQIRTEVEDSQKRGRQATNTQDTPKN